MVLYDLGVVSSPEPFGRLVHQGTILGELEYTRYRDAKGRSISAHLVRGGRHTESGVELTAELVPESAVEKQGDSFVLASEPAIAVDARANKMSKSRGNVVNPDDIVGRFGADAFRLYEMFMGPLEQVKPWSTRGVDGTFRFLNRVWRLLIDNDGNSRALELTEPSEEQLRLLHQTIAKVTNDFESMRFNTAIAALMEFTNAANKWQSMPRSAADKLILLLSPMAPHIAEELWARLGHAESLAYEPWPDFDAAYLVSDTVELAVQINGKVRGRISVAADASEEQVLAAAKSDANVARHLEGKPLRRAIYVPGRIVNFVIAN
jgi:leucyl-tRNA synthetase